MMTTQRSAVLAAEFNNASRCRAAVTLRASQLEDRGRRRRSADCFRNRTPLIKILESVLSSQLQVPSRVSGSQLKVLSRRRSRPSPHQRVARLGSSERTEGPTFQSVGSWLSTDVWQGWQTLGRSQRQACRFRTFTASSCTVRRLESRRTGRAAVNSVIEVFSSDSRGSGSRL